MKFSEIIDVINAVSNSIAESPELESFCLNEFGKDFLVYSGINYEDPPGIEESPFVVLSEPLQTWKERTVEIEMLISCVVADKRENTSSPKQHVFKGLGNSISMASIVQRAIVLGFRGAAYKISFRESISETLFPLFCTTTVLILEVLKPDRMPAAGWKA